MAKNTERRNNFYLVVGVVVLFFVLVGFGTNWRWPHRSISNFGAEISPRPAAGSGDVRILQPSPGTLLSGGNSSIVAKTSTPSRLIVELIEGVIVKTCQNTTTCTGQIDVSGISSGTKTIVVISIDASGNVTSSKVTVNR